LIILLDAQLSPNLASWITKTFRVKTRAVRDISLRDSSDHDIYQSARKANAIVMTKDSDFLTLQNQFGPPPKLLWVTCGNTSNDHLKKILKDVFPTAMKLLNQGQVIVEITDPFYDG
jgi:predicted nuclease of predicted toxin-antitoxin system